MIAKPHEGYGRAFLGQGRRAAARQAGNVGVGIASFAGGPQKAVEKYVDAARNLNNSGRLRGRDLGKDGCGGWICTTDLWVMSWPARLRTIN